MYNVVYPSPLLYPHYIITLSKLVSSMMYPVFFAFPQTPGFGPTGHSTIPLPFNTGPSLTVNIHPLLLPNLAKSPLNSVRNYRVI